MHRSLLSLFLLFTTVVVIGCRHTAIVDLASSEDVVVITTTSSLAEFVQAVGGDLVTVTSLTPAGVEPHDYEPTPRDIAQIAKADIFVINGAGLDPWAEDAAASLSTESTTIITMADHVSLLSSDGVLDPHFWLDPVIAQEEVAVIRDALIALDPTQGQRYQEQSQEYLTSLQALHARYQEGLASCATRELIVSHQAFTYLAQRYALTLLPVSPSPNTEPLPQQLAALATAAVQKSLDFIFSETLKNPASIQTLADEIGAEILSLHPLEWLTAEEQAAGETYLSLMEKNLEHLRKGLSCQ